MKREKNGILYWNRAVFLADFSQPIPLRPLPTFPFVLVRSSPAVDRPFSPLLPTPIPRALSGDRGPTRSSLFFPQLSVVGFLRGKRRFFRTALRAATPRTAALRSDASIFGERKGGGETEPHRRE